MNPLKNITFSSAFPVLEKKLFLSGLSATKSFTRVVPYTGEKIEINDVTTIAEITEKYNKTKQFQKEWENTPIQERIEAIQKFNDLLQTNKNNLADILSKDMGKPVQQSKNELTAEYERIKFFTDNVEKAIETQTVKQEGKETLKISQEPLGVIANISAWNYPYFVGSNVFIPALLTGNTVLYKPSEYALGTGEAITSLLYEAGIPESAFQMIKGDGKTGEELLNHKFDGVFFTGSVETGKKISTQVAPSLPKKLQLELGGKDAAYVCSDVTSVKDVAVALADGAFYNTGQSCCSVERIFVQKEIYDEFLEHFLKEVESWKIGDPFEEGTYISCLALNQTISTLNNQIEDAIKKGAKIKFGGKQIDRPGNYFEPTVVTDVKPDMKIFQEESFGPIVTISSVGSDEEAIELMNNTQFGLTSSVYSNDQSKAELIMKDLDSGTVYWNACDRVSPYVPWSGRKNSGVGSTLGNIGITTFVQPKSWTLMNSS